ncbi:unnamed protein product [Linum trigynum]|uniref:Uncharacterized protein n=1 Tax=Linum trigynum TaxID=586398 RepID=A0AAV2G4R9_9ROSI
METLPRRNLSPRRNHHPSGLRYDSSTTIDGPSHPSAILRFTPQTTKKNLSQSSEFLEKLWSGVGCTLGKTNRTEQGVEHVPDYKRERLGSLQNGAMTMKIFMVQQLLMSSFNES